VVNQNFEPARHQEKQVQLDYQEMLLGLARNIFFRKILKTVKYSYRDEATQQKLNGSIPDAYEIMLSESQ